MATTKNVKLGATYPPAEVRENTKARRAWLAAEVERRQQEPNVTAKVCGTGSYQYVSASRAVVVEGRTRHRGMCQFCGGAQVVQGGRLVLHGYDRPGVGYVFNRCPGTGALPLQTEQRMTEMQLGMAEQDHRDYSADVTRTAIVEKAALDALYPRTSDGTIDRAEDNASRSEPRAPIGRSATTDEIEQYHAARKVWAAEFPLSAHYQDAQQDHRTARDNQWKAAQRRTHFQYLLDLKLLGTALIEETVA